MGDTEKQKRMNETLAMVDKTLVKNMLMLCDGQGMSQLSIIASVCSLFGNVMGQSLAAINSEGGLHPDHVRQEVAFFGTVAASLALEVYASVRAGADSEDIYKQ